MNSFPFSIKDGEINGVSYKYYEIPTHTPDGRSTILYRGDTDLYPSYQKPVAPAFFSTEPKFVKHYGLVFRFKPVQTLKLLALDNASNYSEFYDSLKNDSDKGPAMQRILRDNYGYETGSRFSEYIEDYKLVNYLCGIGMDGYAINRMEIPSDKIDAVVDEYEGEEYEKNRKFHPEMAICDVNKIEYVNPQEDISAYTEQQIEDAKEKRFLDKEKYSFEANRKNKNRNKVRPSFKGNSLFGDDDEDIVDNFENVDNRQNSFKGNLFGDDDSDYNTPPSTPRRGGKTRKLRSKKHKKKSTAKARYKSNAINKKKSTSKLQKKHKNKRSTKKVKKNASKKSKGRSCKKMVYTDRKEK